MDGQQSLEVIMSLIMHGGNAKGDAMEATVTAKSGDFELADRKIVDAEESLVHAHHLQTGMLTEEVKGDNTQVALLTVYSQDHLMTAIVPIDLAKEIIGLYHHTDNE